MSTIEVKHGYTEPDAVVAAATAGDESAFSLLVVRHRSELQAHCYRILGSYEESEDATQEAFLRAWRSRASFQGRASFRAWLYGIATNTCLSARRRRVGRLDARSDPDGVLAEVAATGNEPHADVVSQETIELAVLVAIQHLPPRQRAVLFLRDLLGWSTKETAELLETSIASVTSALQRARETLRARLPERRLEWAAGADPSPTERALLRRYLDAAMHADAQAFAAILQDDRRGERRAASG